MLSSNVFIPTTNVVRDSMKCELDHALYSEVSDMGIVLWGVLSNSGETVGSVQHHSPRSHWRYGFLLGWLVKLLFIFQKKT